MTINLNGFFRCKIYIIICTFNYIFFLKNVKFLTVWTLTVESFYKLNGVKR